ncbi:MAG: porin [Alphaproteobacteria bacterium]|nr:porin [Alphaproteobacteria bacterium]
MTRIQLIGSVSLIALAINQTAFAEAGSEKTPSAADFQNILLRLEQLEKENKSYKDRLQKIETTRPDPEGTPLEVMPLAATSPATAADTNGQNKSTSHEVGGFVRFNPTFSYGMLDQTTNVNRKQLYLLEQKQLGNISKDGVYIGGSVTAIMDFWNSNTDDKFGYLMRHPTSNNQIGNTVTEAGVHSAQLSFLANMGEWVTAYGEFLYDPQQSFGAGDITDLTRNQIQLRKGYVTLGNLNKSPFYLSVGKMATPFALTDTVNPFSASSSWHAFGGLAYGALLGYSKDGLNVSAELVQGGSQFRAANVPVNGTSVPSKLNNYVIDANYTFNLGGDNNRAMVGASYERGSTYCQGYPVVHFNPCEQENPAWAIYGTVEAGPFKFIGEYIQTTDVWPGTFNPTPPLDIYPASKVTSFTLGGKYGTALYDKRLDLSFEYSTFISGAAGSPWERQNQWVLGAAYFLTDSVKLFGEGILVQGYTPLNFISGGNLLPGTTHSDQNVRNTGVVMGINVAF